MDSTHRRPSASVIGQLLEQPRRFNAIQAMRLLRRHLNDQYPGQEWTTLVRIRPELSLNFPAGDIVALEQSRVGSDEIFELTLSFLGLYGTSSPLPTYYTEELFAERQNDSSMLREFFDLLQQPLYRLYHQVWVHYRWPQQILEEGHQRAENRLLALMGRGLETLRQDRAEAVSLLRYLGLFTQAPRSALGLETLLRDALQLPQLRVRSCCLTWHPLARDQQAQLGEQACQLGEECYLGQQFLSASDTVEIELGVLDLKAWQHMAPASSGEESLRKLCRTYLLQPLQTRLKTVVRDPAMTTACLNGPLNRLGQDSWLFSGNPPACGLEAYSL